MTPKEWMRELAATHFDAAFNPYSDVCPVFDLENAPSHRHSALLSCVEKAVEADVDAIWVARDLGYRGGRRTGLALTDDVHLDRHAARWCLDIKRHTKGAPVAEATASVIWKSLDRIPQPVFLWNVFPLHPHLAGQPFTNRAHTAMEREFGLAVLDALLGLLKPRRVVAIGGDAVRACGRLGFKSEAVRHPSYGGSRVFTEQIERIYELPRQDEQALLL